MELGVKKISMAVDWINLEEKFSGYLAGDPVATRQFMDKLQAILKKYFQVRTASLQDAEELTQACLLKVHLSRSAFDPNAASLKTWVFTIASRLLIDLWRKQNRVQVEELEYEGHPMPAGELNHGDIIELNEMLEKSLEALTPLDRSIVYLYGVEGLQMAEIAKVHGLSENAVKLRASRSYKKLQATLSENDSAK